LQAPVASLTTLAKDGSPQSTLIWFLYDDGELAISLNEDRLKTKHLKRDPRISLLIPDYSNPQRYLEVRGTVTLEPDPDYGFAGKVGEKYGADLKNFDAPGSTRIKATVKPANVYPVDLSA
jgi:PPOX class probable F420-dependent enzyme